MTESGKISSVLYFTLTANSDSQFAISLLPTMVWMNIYTVGKENIQYNLKILGLNVF